MILGQKRKMFSFSLCWPSRGGDLLRLALPFVLGDPAEPFLEPLLCPLARESACSSSL